MKSLIAVFVAMTALALPAGAQPAAPPPQSYTAINTYCWDGSAVVMCGASPGASPTAPTFTKPGTFTPLGCRPWQAITTASPVLLSAFSGGIPAGATLVDIVPSVTVVMRDDGSAPGVAGPGIPIQTNTIYPYSGSLSAVQFIAQTTTGTIAVCFFR